MKQGKIKEAIFETNSYLELQLAIVATVRLLETKSNYEIVLFRENELVKDRLKEEKSIESLSELTILDVVLGKLKKFNRSSSSGLFREFTNILGIDLSLRQLTILIQEDMEEKYENSPFLKNNFKEIKSVMESICTRLFKAQKAGYFSEQFEQLKQIGFGIFGIGIRSSLKKFLRLALIKNSFLENFLYLKISASSLNLRLMKHDEAELIAFLLETLEEINQDQHALINSIYKGNETVQLILDKYLLDQEEMKQVNDKYLTFEKGIMSKSSLSTIEDEVIYLSQAYHQLSLRQKYKLSQRLKKSGLLYFLKQLNESNCDFEENFLEELLVDIVLDLEDNIDRDDVKWVIGRLCPTKKINFNCPNELVAILIESCGYVYKNVKLMVEEKHENNRKCYAERLRQGPSTKITEKLRQLYNENAVYFERSISTVIYLVLYLSEWKEDKLAELMEAKLYSVLAYIIEHISDYFLLCYSEDEIDDTLDGYFAPSIQQKVARCLRLCLQVFTQKLELIKKIHPYWIYDNSLLIESALNLLSTIGKPSISRRLYHEIKESVLALLRQVGQITSDLSIFRTAILILIDSFEYKDMMQCLNCLLVDSETLTNQESFCEFWFSNQDVSEAPCQNLFIFSLHDDFNFLQRLGRVSVAGSSLFELIITWSLGARFGEVQCEIAEMIVLLSRSASLGAVSKIYEILLKMLNHSLNEDYDRYIKLLRIMERVQKYPILKVYSTENRFAREFLVKRLQNLNLQDNSKNLEELSLLISIFDTLCNPKYGINYSLKRKAKLNYIIEDIPPESHIQNFIKELSTVILKLAEFDQIEANKHILDKWICLLCRLAENHLGINILLFTDYTKNARRKINPIVGLEYEFQYILQKFTEDRIKYIDSLCSLLKLLHRLLLDPITSGFCASPIRKSALCILIFGKVPIEKLQQKFLFLIEDEDSNITKQGDLICKILMFLERFIENGQRENSTSAQIQALMYIAQLIKWLSKDISNSKEQENPDLGMPGDLTSRLEDILQGKRRSRKDYVNRFHKQIPTLTNQRSLLDLMYRVRLKLADTQIKVPSTLDMENFMILESKPKKTKSLNTEKLENEIKSHRFQYPQSMEEIGFSMTHECKVSSPSEFKVSDFTLIHCSPLFKTRISESKKRKQPQQNSNVTRNMTRNYGSRTPSLHVDEFQASKNAPKYSVQLPGVVQQVQQPFMVGKPSSPPPQSQQKPGPFFHNSDHKPAPFLPKYYQPQQGGFQYGGAAMPPQGQVFGGVNMVPMPQQPYPPQTAPIVQYRYPYQPQYQSYSEDQQLNYVNYLMYKKNSK